MENKTAIDWYFDKIKSHFEHDGDLLETVTFAYAIAKQKEKQQIIDAFYQCGRDNFEHIKVINRSATDYYNETYGSKGSDDINRLTSNPVDYQNHSNMSDNFKQFSLYEHKETIATADTPTYSQTENKGLDWLVSHWEKLQLEGEKMNWEQIIQITELAKEVPSSQTEISDEEIDKEWINYQKQFLEKFMKDTMIAGYAITNKETFAKWYREQLKSKQ